MTNSIANAAHADIPVAESFLPPGAGENIEHVLVKLIVGCYSGGSEMTEVVRQCATSQHG